MAPLMFFISSLVPLPSLIGGTAPLAGLFVADCQGSKNCSFKYTVVFVSSVISGKWSGYAGPSTNQGQGKTSGEMKNMKGAAAEGISGMIYGDPYLLHYEVYFRNRKSCGLPVLSELHCLRLRDRNYT